ncbi:hypothetical protein [Methylomonas sp. 11b]|uniref:hypothetical protein n=2 Tax=unclassified Methylomonas TaxID=2608980 RepID=UPI00047E1D71|nr:hypothetical protein [Methylomonas sp. 11b]
MLTTWPFLICLVSLIANDWWLKAAYPGVFTGKLSDFAGVAVVSLMTFSALPHRKWLLCLLISVTFLWWKSPLSDSMIHLANSLSILRIGRVVDYSDLWALLVVPVCLHVSEKQSRFRIASKYFRKMLTVPVSVVTLFGVMGTSALPIREEYTVRPVSSSTNISREQLVSVIAEVAAKHELTCYICKGTPRADSARYFGESLSMTYTLTPENAVLFVIEYSPGGPLPTLFRESSYEKAAALRTSLKSSLAEHFDGLEFVELLRK